MSSLTAIIPCYNAEKTLAQAIESVLAQTRPVDQCIVVDDCSSDGSRELASRYPVEVIRTETNVGHAAARNLALSIARGDYIAWLDADDFWDPHHCETVGALLDRFPEAVVAFSSIRYVGSRSGTWIVSGCELTPRNVFWQCFEWTMIPAMTAITRKAPLMDIGGFDGSIRIAPDYELWLRLSRHHPFICTQEVTCSYRWHPSQISSSLDKQISSVYRSRFRYWQRSLGLEDESFVAQMSQTAREIWHRSLEFAWWERNYDKLNQLLDLAPFVPDPDSVAKAWRLKASLPRFVVWLWDRAVAPLVR